MALVRIQVDVNDADYKESRTEVTEEQLELILQVARALKNFEPYQGEWNPGLYTEHRHNFPFDEVVRDDMGEKTAHQLYVETGQLSSEAYHFFVECLPDTYDDDQSGFHTVTLITVIHKEETLYAAK